MSNPTLGSPPLALTLAQVKFNAIPTMVKYYPEIQDEFRKQFDLIFHEPEDSSILQVSPQKTDVIKNVQWSSSSADHKKRLILAHDSLTVETTEYTGFKNFIPDFLDAIEIVKNITQASYVSRIGFRYINRIESSQNKLLDYFLKSQLLGFNFEGNNIISSVSRTEAIAQTKEGVLRVHCMQLISDDDPSRNALLPPDIGTKLIVKPLFTPPKYKYAFLDIDHYKSFDKVPIKLDVDDIEPLLDSLHQGGYDAFISGVNEDALKEWK